jgi:hypothetical protein
VDIVITVLPPLPAAQSIATTTSTAKTLVTSTSTSARATRASTPTTMQRLTLDADFLRSISPKRIRTPSVVKVCL